MDKIRLGCFLLLIVLVHSQLLTVDPSKQIPPTTPISTNPSNGEAGKSQSTIIIPGLRFVQGYTVGFINKQIIPGYIPKQSVIAIQQKIGQEIEEKIKNTNPNFQTKVTEVEKKAQGAAIKASSQMKKIKTKYEEQMKNAAKQNKTHYNHSLSNTSSAAIPPKAIKNYSQQYSKWIKIFQTKNPKQMSQSPQKEVKTDVKANQNQQIKVNCKVDADCTSQFPQTDKSKIVKCDAKTYKCFVN